MVLAIHQPNYFPWLGYLDKMAKADKYIILDEVQLIERSPILRNQFIQTNGEVCLLGLQVQKKGYREKKIKEIELLNIKQMQEKHKRFFELNYGKTKGFSEIWPLLKKIFEKEYTYLIDIDIDTMLLLRELYNINTRLILQSDLDYDKTAKKNNLMLNLSKIVGASIYLSGQGAKAYMDDISFSDQAIKVIYQHFEHPVYKQRNISKFVSGLSSVDMLMQLGIEDARKIFWENVKRTDNTKEVINI